MALWRLYYHLVWATKNREPLIDKQREDELYSYLIGKADSLKCIIHAANGTEDHIHVIASIPPVLSIADFVKQIKGSSAHYLNHLGSNNETYFGWQTGYGVFSMGHKQLEQAVSYVNNQKLHHAQGTVIPSLEMDMNEEDMPEHYQKRQIFPDG
jgi:putative transposase